MATPMEAVIFTIKDVSPDAADGAEIYFILPQFGPSEVFGSLEEALAEASFRFNVVDNADRVQKAAQSFAKEPELFEVPCLVFFDQASGVQVVELRTYSNGQLRPVGSYYRVFTNGGDVALYASSSVADAMQVAIDEVEATLRIKIEGLKPRPARRPRF
ncbi:hypothetical protein ABQF61_06140 [Xanthomonas campestris]|uniref:hypothetical protein n=2 Tax=Xanthomonas campestris TaxID=339 RepID=UPI0011C01E32|nr:hypothetical protein [Xanthomonas campestris]MEA9623816.1 hypothetical protein [Xanthomonas campestris]MEA9642041.1 hypothetical protein [Xanthomonas campestris]MEA9671330.1 hypothetical protein [Xanthomonas campestris]MEA9689981.1 hypothetical protein [Xanthomonas campestris]MEA9695186.1 hypothetical protein [Xanthomonas campestris]